MTTEPVPCTTLVPGTPVMRPPTMAFVDVAYLKRTACRVLDVHPSTREPDAAAVRDWLLRGPAAELAGGPIQRVGWYHGAFDPTHPGAASQHRRLRAVGALDLVQQRLGQLSEIEPPWHDEVRAGIRHIGGDLARFEERCPLTPELRQKGVDVTLAIELVLLSIRPSAIGHAVLISGDADFVPAVEFAGKQGVLVSVLSPDLSSVAVALRGAAARTMLIAPAQLESLLQARPMRPASPAAAPCAAGTPLPATRTGGAARGVRRSGASPAPVRRALRAVPSPTPSAPGTRARDEGRAPAAAAPREPDAGAPSSLAELLEGRVDGKWPGLALRGPENPMRIYLAVRPEDPESVGVYVGDTGDPALDRRVGSHEVLRKLQPVA